MLRLDLTSEPRWLTLAPGLALRLAPLTTSLMVAARADLAVAALCSTGMGSATPPAIRWW